MKRALMALSIAAVFGLALYANAYAGSMEDQNSMGTQESMGVMAPFETPGSTSAPSGGFGYYGADFHGAPVGNSEAEIQSRYGQGPATTEEGQPYRPWLTPGSTTPSSGGFGYYGAGPYTEIENPERGMQTQYGQAPASMEEEGQVSHPYEGTPGSTTPPSGGFGYY